MKMLKNYKKVLGLMLAVFMLISLAACGGAAADPTADSTASNSQNTTSASTKSEAKEPITLTIFEQNGRFTTNGVQNDPVSKRIAEVTGVTLENIGGDKEKLKVLAAGGELPDIVKILQAPELCASLIQSGTVIPLDELLDKYGQNIKEAIPTALKASMLTITPTKDKTYFIPANVQKADLNNPKKNSFVGFFTRWDIYKAIGAPEIKNEDDYLNILKKMVDYQPTTKDGKKVYALSGWIDWGLWPYTISYPFTHGYTNSNAGLVNCETGELESLYLKEDGIMWKSLKFFNKANQLGIFDPEAFTMKNAQYDAKVKTGQVLVSATNWNVPDKSVLGPEVAMYILPGSCPYITQVYPEDNLLGYKGGDSIAISSKCKYPERAMEVLNYINSDEGARYVLNGNKGVDWDIADGKPVLLGKLLKNKMSGAVEEPDYVKPGNPNGIERYAGFFVQDTSNPAKDGFPYSIAASIDYKIKTAQPVDKDFAQHYGGADAVYPGQAYAKMIKDGLAKMVKTSYPLYAGLSEIASDDTNRIISKADQYINANIAKIILAKTDAEFDAQKKKTIEDIKAMGFEKAWAEKEALYKKGQKLAESFK